MIYKPNTQLMAYVFYFTHIHIQNEKSNNNQVTKGVASSEFGQNPGSPLFSFICYLECVIKYTQIKKGMVWKHIQASSRLAIIIRNEYSIHISAHYTQFLFRNIPFSRIFSIGKIEKKFPLLPPWFLNRKFPIGVHCI